jgi:hypothetical protein
MKIPFSYFKTSPEIGRSAMMMYVRFGSIEGVAQCPKQTKAQVMDSVGGTHMLIEDPDGTVPLDLKPWTLGLG